MRKIISSVVKALADFIEFDDAVELGIKNGALNDLNKKLLAEAQREELLKRYARAWTTSGDTVSPMTLELQRAHALIQDRRLERKRQARVRQAERTAARELKEMGFAN